MERFNASPSISRCRAELAALVELRESGHPDKIGIERAIDDWILCETRLLLNEHME